jgi:hypothetical protein
MHEYQGCLQEVEWRVMNVGEHIQVITVNGSKEEAIKISLVEKRMHPVGHSLENCFVFARCPFLFSR